MNKILSRKWNDLITVLIGASILFIYLVFKNITVFYHDTNGYWLMSEEFLSDKVGFMIPRISQTTGLIRELFSLRGYILPMFIAIVRIGGGETFIGYWLCLSLLYSIGYIYISKDI